VKVLIHQALCGERPNEESRGFSLLKTTLEDKTLAKRICPKTNLADLPSSGISWTSAVRGFVTEQHYLIIKTYPDNSPNVRPGRLFSHVLIIDKRDIEHVNDLSILFSYFQTEINKDLTIGIIEYQKETVHIEQYNTREKKIAEGIINGEKNIIWIGQTGFEEMICKIWRGLDINSRCNLHFGIQFNSTQVDTNNFNILVIPENIAVQWRNKMSFNIIELHENDITLSLATESILGNDDAKAKIKEFATQLETFYPTIENLKTWEWCINATQRIEEQKEYSIADLKQLLYLICIYTPDKNKGDSFKQKILSYLTELLANSSEISDILALKNADFKSIKNAHQMLGKIILEWCKLYLTDKIYNENNPCISIIKKSFDTKNTSEWWREAIKESIVNKFKYWKKDYAELCWMWFNEEPNTFNIIYPVLSEYNNRQIECDLISTFPRNIATNLLLDIASFSAKEGWYKLHAVSICELHEGLIATLERQLQVDVKEDNIDGFEFIANCFNSLDFIGEAAHLNDERLWTIAGKLLPQTNFIEKLDYSYVGWYHIICKAIEQGTAINELFSYPLGFTHSVLDSILQGYDLPNKIWRILVNSKLTDIYDYEQRAKAWDIIPINFKKTFLQTTAASYISFDAGKEKNEKELHEYLNGNEFCQNYFSQNRQNLSAILILLAKVNVTNQTYLVDYLREYNVQIPKLDAITLGKFIVRKRWEGCAEIIYEKSKYNESYRVVLQECYSLLGLFTRITISLLGWLANVAISKNEWWNELHNIACELFPKGPNDEDLWEKADGNESELFHNTTGEQAWGKALKNLRNGGCKDITTDKLLNVMKDRYPYNQQLNELSELYKRI
jgi:hypothetical protein